MTKEQIKRYNQLKTCFDSWGNFIYFKGSKNQRKNALKEWNKLCIIKHKEDIIASIELWKSRISELEQWNAAMSIISTKFWWEVTSENIVEEMKRIASNAQKNVSRFMNYKRKDFNKEYTINECLDFAKTMLISLENQIIS